MKKQRLATASAIRKFLESADTHLDWVVERNPAGKNPRLFHVDTVIEYLEESLKLAKSLRK